MLKFEKKPSCLNSKNKEYVNQGWNNIQNDLQDQYLIKNTKLTEFQFFNNMVNVFMGRL